MFDHIAPAFLEEILGFLVPLFMTGAGGDTVVARQTALAALAAYDVVTEQELRLAAEITCLGFGVLESLAKSMNPDLPVNAVLRLRGNANALHRSAYQNQRVLDRLRQQRLAAQTQAPAAEPESDPVTEPPSADRITGANSPTTPIFRSRQERRAAERKAAKLLRQQAEHDRLSRRRAEASSHPFASTRLAS